MIIKKIDVTKYMFVCFVISIIFSVCYAAEVQFPGNDYAGKGWKWAAQGQRGKQLKFTSVKMIVDGKDVTKWDDPDNEENPYSYFVDLDSDANIAILCEGDANIATNRLKVFDYDDKNPPAKTCPTGKGIYIDFASPDNANKSKCTYVADITAVDPAEQKESVAESVVAQQHAASGTEALRQLVDRVFVEQAASFKQLKEAREKLKAAEEELNG